MTLLLPLPFPAPERNVLSTRERKLSRLLAADREAFAAELDAEFGPLVRVEPPPAPARLLLLACSAKRRSAFYRDVPSAPYIEAKVQSIIKL